VDSLQVSTFHGRIRLADPVPVRHRPRRPARRAVLGHRVQRVMHDRFHNVVAEHNRAATPVYPIGFTLAKWDPFGTPSTSHWTGAAIIAPSPRTKTCIVTRSRTSTRPMPFSLAG
jgi:hypothetical protein